MRYFPKTPGPTAWLFLFCVAGFVASGAALATTQVPVTDYVVIQPIVVCQTKGWISGQFSPLSCASFNSTVNPNPATATSATTIGFVDPPPPAGTNINNTRAIWLQAGIDVTFLPLVQYNNSSFQNISVTCSTSDNPCSGSLASTQFKDLSSGSGAAAGTTVGCTSHCLDPVGANAPFPNGNAIDMFFVNSLVPGTGVSSPLFGFAWINGNGIAVATNAFLSAPAHIDTLAHEIGHNFGLDHNSGGGLADNVMTAGSIRTVPKSTGCSSTNGGALFDLDVLTIFDCSTLPANPVADQLINTQESTVFPSGFLNPNANLNAIAGGGGDFPVEVDFVSDGRFGESLVEFDLSLPKGFEFCDKPFTLTSTNGPQVFGTPQVVQDNSQGNSNSQGDQGNLSVLRIDFVRGTFTVGTSFFFMSDICNENTGQLVTDRTVLECTTPSPTKCMNATFKTDDLRAVTSDFGPSGTASTQFPNATVPSVIFDANTVPSLAGTGLTFTGFTQTPCTLFEEEEFCPPLAGGDPTGPD